MNPDTADRNNPRLLESPDGSASKPASDPDSLFWHHFAQAKTAKSFCQSWLPLQCRMLRGVKHAIVLLGNPDQGPYTPVAVWPDAKLSMNHLAGTAERSIRERRGLLVDKEGGPPAVKGAPETCQIAYPIEVAGKIHGVVVMEVEAPFKQDVQALMRQLHWGAA